jgi:hypothetical protein
MSVETTVLGLIILFLLFALVIGYHVMRMMNRHYPAGGMYPPMGGSVAEDKKGGIPTAFYLAFIVFVAIALVVVYYEMNGLSGGLINGGLRRVMTTTAPPQSTRLGFSDAKRETESNYSPRSLDSDYSGGLADFGNTRRPADFAYSDQKDEIQQVQTSTPTPVSMHGYQVTCSSSFKFVGDDLKDYQKVYKHAQIFTYGQECRYKLVLYAATTKQEVERWISRSKQLPKGYIASLSE